MTETSLAIRPVRADDIAPLARLLAPLELFTTYSLSVEALEKRWNKALAGGDDMLVATDGNNLLGLCWFLRHGAFGFGAYLRVLAVGPDAHNRGVGAALLDAYESACLPAPGGWFLLTSDFNHGAQRFYARHGYREVGRLPDFAKPGITELVYWKPAPGAP